MRYGVLCAVLHIIVAQRLVVTAPVELNGDEYEVKFSRLLPEPIEGYLQVFEGCDMPASEDVDRWKTIWLFAECANTTELMGVVTSSSLFRVALFVDPTLEAPSNVTLGGIDIDTATDLVHAVRQHEHVKVLLDSHERGWIDCDSLGALADAGAGLVPVWGAVAVMWAYNTWSRAETTHMQRFMLLAPIIKVAVSFVSWFMWELCPWDTRASQYFVMAYMGMSTMYQTILFAILLLLSKGWTCTREAFTRCESAYCASLVSLVYIAVSAHYVDSNMMTPILAGLYWLLGCVMMCFCRQNLKALRIQLAFVHANRVTPLQEALLVKIGMFQNLSLVIGLFVVGQSTCLAAQAAEQSRSVTWNIVLSVLDLIVFIALALIFRARSSILFFGPPPPESGPRSVAPLYICSPFAKADEAKPPRGTSLVVVVNPGDPAELAAHPWKHVMVGCGPSLRLDSSIPISR